MATVGDDSRSRRVRLHLLRHVLCLVVLRVLDPSALTAAERSLRDNPVVDSYLVKAVDHPPDENELEAVMAAAFEKGIKTTGDGERADADSDTAETVAARGPGESASLGETSQNGAKSTVERRWNSGNLRVWGKRLAVANNQQQQRKLLPFGMLPLTVSSPAHQRSRNDIGGEDALKDAGKVQDGRGRLSGRREGGGSWRKAEDKWKIAHEEAATELVQKVDDVDAAGLGVDPEDDPGQLMRRSWDKNRVRVWGRSSDMALLQDGLKDSAAAAAAGHRRQRRVWD